MPNTLQRRQFLSRSLATAGTVFAATGTTLLAQQKPKPSVDWYDVREWGLEGRGFNDTEKYFDRLPARAKGAVRNVVWNLSRHSAGMMVQFRTDATAIHAQHSVTGKTLAMPHMPATGMSGLDLYAKDDNSEWRWVQVTRPTSQTMNVVVASGLRPGIRDYAIYLPLYNGTESLKIGVPKGGTFETIAPRKQKPIVFYGTSITHGACASRPGMPHPSILGRRLNRPIINLGFSGNGKLEKAVGNFLTELDPAVYVLDCLPNMVAKEVTARTEPMVKQLRNTHPKVPIVLVEDRTYANSWIMPSKQKRNDSSRAAFRLAYKSMQDAGIENLFYVDGASLLAKNGDDTTDGSHPSDLGFFNQANAIEPALRKALKKTLT